MTDKPYTEEDMKLVAYHNDPAIKANLLASLKAHAKADAIIHGTYWEEGKGCAVGCTLESIGHSNHDDHMAYETKLGIPVMLARLEDTIFEGLPNGKAKAWPVRFSQAIKPGADLSLVGWKFQHWILTGSGLINDGGREDVRAAIKQCADVLVPLTKGLPVDVGVARSAVWSAESAWPAARSAAESARYAAWSAESAARSAESAWSAARSAESAAWSAWPARSAAYERMAEKLLRLLRAAKANPIRNLP